MFIVLVKLIQIVRFVYLEMYCSNSRTPFNRSNINVYASLILAVPAVNVHIQFYVYIMLCVLPRLLLCAVLQCCIISPDVRNGPSLQLNRQKNFFCLSIVSSSQCCCFMCLFKLSIRVNVLSQEAQTCTCTSPLTL